MLHVGRRWGRYEVMAGLLGLIQLAVNSAQAETAAAGEAHATPGSAPMAMPARWSFDVGLGLALGLSDIEEQQGDSVEISSVVFAELTVAPSYWLTPRFALGLHTSWGFEPGQRGLASSSGESEDKERTLWQLTAAARYQRDAGQGWYLTANGGAAALVDSIGNDSVTQWAPLVGAALGVDFRAAEIFALGLELRGGHAWFSAQGSTLTVADGLGAGETQYHYGATTWLGLNLVGRFLL
jgi:hypothetical protein